MRLVDLPTPCLVLDRVVLLRNLRRMQAIATAHRVGLRPHMKTAKSIDVARLAFEVAREAQASRPGAITVSTLAEAEYFASHDVTDILYAVGITPQKLDQVAKLNQAGASVMVVTDDPDGAAAIAAHPSPPRVLIEIDTGEGRGGVAPDSPLLPELAARLGTQLAGVMAHAGHSYAARDPAEVARIAEIEVAGAVEAARRLSALGHSVDIVSVGSTPTALHGPDFSGVTELRAGVYMFGDLFQYAIGSHRFEDMAVTVMASVIGRRPAPIGGIGRVLLDSGAIALSKDRSTAATARDEGFGLMLGLDGTARFGHAVARRVWQEHAMVEMEPAMSALPALGDKVRLAVNHVCLAASAHDRYFVVDGGQEVTDVWPRVNGW